MHALSKLKVKQTRPVMKFSWHGFSETGVKKTQLCWLRPPAQVRLEMNLTGEHLGTLGKWADYIWKTSTFFILQSKVLKL